MPPKPVVRGQPGAPGVIIVVFAGTVWWLLLGIHPAHEVTDLVGRADIGPERSAPLRLREADRPRIDRCCCLPPETPGWR
jgi:hypothetical protein